MMRRHLDLPLNRDGSVRFLPWIVALMVYLASLALAGTLVVRDVVTRWDRGEYEILDSTPTRLTMRLTGNRLRGVAGLERSAGDRDSS